MFPCGNSAAAIQGAGADPGICRCARGAGRKENQPCHVGDRSGGIWPWTDRAAGRSSEGSRYFCECV